MSKFVKFVGTRVPNMRVHVLIDGRQTYSRGYLAGKDTVLELPDGEADVLTGVTPPVHDESGNVVTGFIVDGNLGEAGLAGEKWQEIQNPYLAVSDEDASLLSPAQPVAITIDSTVKKKTTKSTEIQATSDPVAMAV